MSTIASPLALPRDASPTTPSTSTASADPSDPLASESTFLTLLVSQLQNQDPTTPIDSTTFVSQLTSYSQLEQLIDINGTTTTIATNTTPPAASSTGTTTGS
jgi:flagellar basal-body rod modification protein FlgD